MRGELKATIAAHRLQDRVEVSPRVPSGRVPDILRSLHAVVLPSLTTPTWKEQFGRVLIEAMACEVPVVGSSSGEIPEVIGDAGLVVPEGNVDALAGALQRLYEDEELRKRLGMLGRQRVLQHFTHTRIARLTHEAYARTLEL
jgi:glycosyltransferase involved in cell wall biosynthesis